MLNKIGSKDSQICNDISKWKRQWCFYFSDKKTVLNEYAMRCQAVILLKIHIFINGELLELLLDYNWNYFLQRKVKAVTHCRRQSQFSQALTSRPSQKLSKVLPCANTILILSGTYPGEHTRAMCEIETLHPCACCVHCELLCIFLICSCHSKPEPIGNFA